MVAVSAEGAPIAESALPTFLIHGSMSTAQNIQI
jgi:hypothetical protein